MGGGGGGGSEIPAIRTQNMVSVCGVLGGTWRQPLQPAAVGACVAPFGHFQTDGVVFSSGADSVVAALLSSSKSWGALPSEDALPRAVTSAGAVGPAPDFRRPGRPSDFASAGGPGQQGRRSRLGLGATLGGGAGGGPASGARAGAAAAPSGAAGALMKRVHRDAWRKQARRRDEEEVLARGAVAAGLAGDSDGEEDEETRCHRHTCACLRVCSRPHPTRTQAPHGPHTAPSPAYHRPPACLHRH